MNLKRLRKNELIGVFFYLIIIVAGFTFIIKFIQLGIPDFIINHLNLSNIDVVGYMMLLALLTASICLIVGYIIDKFNWRVEEKIKILFLCFLIQTPLILSFLSFNSVPLFILWIILLGVVMGVETPISISLLRDFIRPKYRGIFAAVATAFIYSYGILSPFPWNISGFIKEISLGLLPSIPIFAIIIVFKLFRNEEKKEIFLAEGSFIHYNKGLLILALFGVIFVDSLGFLRIIETPEIYANVWRGGLEIKMFLVISHTGFALISGFLYTKSKPYLILIISLWMIFLTDLFFALFNETIFLSQVLGILYCGAVSMYTIVLFALWADISAPESVGKFSGLGIGIGGWLMTFISTAFSFRFIDTLSFSMHLLVSSAVSLTFLVLTILIKQRGEN
ncbi:MAG: MFS transporter [Promethearchaeia archaeon]